MPRNWWLDYIALSPQYLAGVCAGAGAGTVTGIWIAGSDPGWVYPIGFLMVMIGSVAANYFQRKDREAANQKP